MKNYLGGRLDTLIPNSLIGRGTGGLCYYMAKSKRVDEFENMSDEELRQYIYESKELDSRQD